MKELVNQTVSVLPDDYYDVIVENDKDIKSLLWLVNRVGEERLKGSVDKYMRRYKMKPYVSTILKAYNFKVPVDVYR